MFVAEHDFPLADPIQRALSDAIGRGDVGYTPPDPGLREPFVAFAQRHWQWSVDPRFVHWTGDVMMGVTEILRAVTTPGDGVVITSPVYPPFTMCTHEAGARVVDVPLRDTGTAWELDLEGIEAAFAAGARAMLLCNPHNPTGTVHSRASLAALAALAETYNVTVLSDEIHAPMTQPGHTFTPYLVASEAAARTGFVITSASKTYNLAGLKCALMIAGDEAHNAILSGLPPEVEWRTGLLGAMAGAAAFDEESDPWLESLVAAIDVNRRLLGELLAEHVPGARYRMPEAGYLAWVDLSDLGWGENPASRILSTARVALNPGPSFGAGGAGHVRVNLGCSPEVLREAVERIGALERS